MYNFDSLADKYSNSVKAVPHAFVELICKNFRLNNNDNILELGCGAGTLTLPLSSYVGKIDAIDISSYMIHIAKKNDIYNKVNWIIADANALKYNDLYYSLILFFETFHLFLDPLELLSKLEKSLLPNGYLCAGFCIYNWETIVAKDIISILNYYGINLTNWFFQIPNEFEKIISEKSLPTMSEIEQRQIKVFEKWSAKQIAKYITSTSISLRVPSDIIQIIQNEIEKVIVQKYSYEIEGMSKYVISFSKKTVSGKLTTI